FFKVSVNVSAVQILEDTFIEDIVKIIDDEKFPYQNLVLELTESHTVQNMSILQFKFKALQDLGIYIAMDDFGTGYSSLEVLKFSPIDVVKIDRVFVKDILKSKFDATFIHFIVAICHDVGIKVCLEGVETQEEYDLVKQMKPDYIQGYLFGKPQTATEIFDLLKLDN
ncbi:EAL domain-containing protein, partial [Clostridioides difficile]